METKLQATPWEGERPREPKHLRSGKSGLAGTLALGCERRLVLRRFEFLLELLHLRANHDPAVGLVRIGAVVILVIILGLVELLQRHNLGDDGLAEMLLRLGF